MNLFNLFLRINGFSIYKAKVLLQSIQGKDDAAFQSYVDLQKKEIVSYHLKNNSFYKSLVQNIGVIKWEALPVMTKRDLQVPLKERLSDGFSTKNVYVNKTSGSSGNPFVFAKDKFCHAMTWAIFDCWYGWHNIYNTKQARFYGIPLNKKGYYKERFKDFITKRYRFNVFDLSEDALDAWLVKFSKQDFVFITGYTSVLVAFAKHLLSKGIVLSEICPTLKACLPTSEMCSDEDRDLLVKAFNIPIINEYGSAEFGLIALERNKHWVLNNLNLYVEILDNENSVLPYGKEGKIVITDLFNKAHPFIRYDIGDMGSIEVIDGKTRVLKSIIGRKEDYIKLPSGKTAPGLSFYYVTKSVMRDDGFMHEIKVLQHKLNQFEIQYVSEYELNEKQEMKIKKALIIYLEPDIEVLFTRKNSLQRTKRGKLKQFTSLLQS